MKNIFDRNNAFTMNFSDDSEYANDKVEYLIPLQGSLYAFTSTNIFKVLPADSIDPNNLQPETRHSYQKIYSI